MDASPVLRSPVTPPSWAELARLAASHDLCERAFASGELRIRYARATDAGQRAHASSLYAALRARSLQVQAGLRSEIASGALHGAALRARIEACATDVRDHFVEELLDIAYPALEPPDDAHWSHELVPYAPSGVGEILHALDAVKLGPGDTLVDLGAGLGKVVLLASLLTGARGHGVELDARLVAHAQASAASLRLPSDRVRFVNGDAREVDLDVGGIFYMYVPFTGSVLGEVMMRLAHIASRRRIVICAHALDTQRFSWLKNRNTPRFWLDVYEST